MLLLRSRMENIMEALQITNLENVSDLVAAAQRADEPIIVFDGDDECLVAMRPAVMERILFDTSLLNFEHRESLHF